MYIYVYMYMYTYMHIHVVHVSHTNGIRNPNVDFPVKAAESPEGGVNAVGAVGGGHDDDV